MNQIHNIDGIAKTCQYNVSKYSEPSVCGEPATETYEGKTGTYYLCDKHYNHFIKINVGGCMRE